MNLIRLIMRLLYKFTPVEEEEYRKINDEAEQWWLSVRIDEEAGTDKDKTGHPKSLVSFAKFAEMWYSKVVFAFLYIYMVREIMDYLNGPKEESESEDRNVFE